MDFFFFVISNDCHSWCAIVIYGNLVVDIDCAGWNRRRLDLALSFDKE